MALSSTRTQGGVILARRAPGLWVVAGRPHGAHRGGPPGHQWSGRSCGCPATPRTVVDPCRWDRPDLGRTAGIIPSVGRLWDWWIALGLSLLAFGLLLLFRVTSADLQDASGGGTLWQTGCGPGGPGPFDDPVRSSAPPEWEWAFGVGLLWLLGLWPNGSGPDPTVAIDGWQRLASLVALPLLSILVHWQLRNRQRPSSQPVALASALPLVEVVQSISRARDLNST